MHRTVDMAKQVQLAHSSEMSCGVPKRDAREALLAHLRTPLVRNGYALMLSAGVTSGLGLLYWVLAAHVYPPRVVGLNSELIAALLFLSGVAQLNLAGAFTRFLPRAAQATGRLIAYAYLATTLLALGVAGGFLLGLGVWTPNLGFLRSTPPFGAWFVLATAAWGIFALQDMALTGMRQATWVPIENTLCGVAKIVLLIAVAGLAPTFGIFVSWTIPTVVSLLPVNLLIFRSLVRRHRQASSPEPVPVGPRQVIRFVAADYAGSLFALGASLLLPIIVTHELGPEATAYFYLAWLITYSLQLASHSMMASLTVEGAMDYSKFTTLAQHALTTTARLLLPAVAVLVLAAPSILRLFGPAYATHGSMLLRLLALAALPNLITLLYSSAARVRRCTGRVLLVEGAICLQLLGLGSLLLHRYGITGIGVAAVISQSTVAAAVLLTELRPLVGVMLRSRPAFLKGVVSWK
jgi:O-antigen/teichoic acid export membrane protein